MNVYAVKKNVYRIDKKLTSIVAYSVKTNINTK